MQTGDLSKTKDCKLNIGENNRNVVDSIIKTINEIYQSEHIINTRLLLRLDGYCSFDNPGGANYSSNFELAQARVQQVQLFLSNSPKLKLLDYIYFTVLPLQPLAMAI